MGDNDPKTAADAGEAPATEGKLETIKSGTKGLFHYIKNGPRRMFCQGKVSKVHPATKKAEECYDVVVSMEGRQRTVERVKRYDPKFPNRPGFQTEAEAAAMKASKKKADEKE